VQDHQIDTLHTPSFRYSLLSVIELDSQGYHTKFGNGKCSIQNSNVMVMTGSRNGQLFQVEPIHSRYSDRSNLFALLSTAKSHLWHKCLAHLNHVSMKSLVDGYILTDICEVCILAKHERKIIRVPVLLSRSCLTSPCCSTDNVGCPGGLLRWWYPTSLWRYPTSP